MGSKRGFSIWLLASSFSEIWVHLLPQFSIFLLLFIVLHPRGLTLYECFWASFPIGYALVTWIVFIACAIVGHVDPTVIRIIYTVFSMFSIVLLGIALGKIRKQPHGFKEILLEIRREFMQNILVIISLLFFGGLFYTHLLLKDRAGNEWSGGSIWADFAFHLNVINSFLHGENKYFSLFSKLKSQIYAGYPMSYPFIPDFHAASLMAIGMTARQATLIPSILICVALVSLLYSFLRRFLSGKFTSTRSCEKEAFFGVILFLLCGGIGGWTMLRDQNLNLYEIVREDWMQKTSSGQEIYWFGIVCHILMPQRTATYAYPLVALVFTCLYSGINNTKITYTERKRLFILAGIITGLLPLVHAHSFMVVGIVAVVYCLLHPGQIFDLTKNGHFFYWLSFGIPIILLALPQIPNYLDRIVGGDSEGKSFIKFDPLWRHSPWVDVAPSFSVDLNFFVLWWNALNFLFPLSIIGIYYLDVKQRKFYACLWIIFIMANLIMFQPWDKDNTKIFAIWVFMAAGVAIWTLSKWGSKNFVLKLVVILLFVSMITSGTILCIREANLWWMYGGNEEYKVAELIKTQTAHDSIFITSGAHIHPVTNLAGRTTVYGFAGWIHSHGYPNMWDREAELRDFLNYPRDNIDFLKKYNISYLCWDHELDGTYGYDQEFFDKSSSVLVLYQSYKYKIYDIRGLY